jgi:large subunit ribosomal protein L19
MDVMKNIESPQLRTDLPAFNPGDTIRVMVKVIEGEKERLQRFQGVVIGLRGGGLRATFTVRKVSDGVGVERIFPLHSPSISSVEVLKRGRVARSKLYYLRELKGRKARIREKREVAPNAGSEVAPRAGSKVAPSPGGEVAPSPGGKVAPSPGSEVAPSPGGEE